MSILFSKWLASESFSAYHLQRLSPGSTETLLDRHLATFDRWLQGQLSLSASSRTHYYLTVVALFDQLDLKEYNWQQQVLVILQDHLLPAKLFDLFGGTKANIEFSRIVSKFLIDQERAGLFWVNSQKYADLVWYILEFLRDK